MLAWSRCSTTGPLRRGPLIPSHPVPAIGYLRVSTEEQARDGVSLDAQRRAVHSYCELRHLDLAGLVVDAGVSAGKPLASREGGSRVLEAASKRAVRAVVAFKLDRLFRNAGDCLSVVEGWERRGVALHLIDLGGQAIDTSSAAGKFFLTVMAGAAEMERNQIRERTRAGMAEKRARREYTGGHVPYGYVVGDDGRGLVVHRGEQGIIESIHKLRDEGRSLRGIVERLNADGVPARGARWHLKAVATIARRDPITTS